MSASHYYCISYFKYKVVLVHRIIQMTIEVKHNFQCCTLRKQRQRNEKNCTVKNHEWVVKFEKLYNTPRNMLIYMYMKECTYCR